MIVSLPCALLVGTAIMLHGAGGGGWEYDKWKPVFEKAGWQVIARDLVPSSKGLAKTTLEDYMDQASVWVPKDRKGPLVVIGASMGGPIALRVAARLHASAVVLVDSVAPRGVGPKPKSAKFPPIIQWANGPLKDTQDSMPDSDEATILWAWKRWRDESGLAMAELSSGPVCPVPTCPALVVLGRQDTDVPWPTGLAIAEWAHADTRVYAAMSHVGPLLSRRAQEVAGDVVAWLRHRELSDR